MFGFCLGSTLPPMLIFESCNGFPVPRLARDGSGAERVPDGVRYFDVDQAAARFNAPAEILEQLHADFFADLLAPDATPDTAEAREDVALAVLHRTRFPHLSREDFEAVMIECHRRRLNAWARQIWATNRWNDDRKRNELVMGTTIDGFRAIAHSTGECAGINAAVFDYGDDEKHPIKAKVAVYRMVGGERRRFIGRALWSERAVDGDWFWENKPHDMLEKCAEAAAHRRAFPELLGGLYEPSEVARTTALPRRKPASVPAPIPGDDAPPLTRFRFELELVDLGFGNIASRNALVEGFRVKHGELYAADQAGFFAMVLRAVRANPKAYGGDGAPGMMG